MKILAVEDDPIAQLVLEAALTSLGHEVVLAVDGEEALVRMKTDPVRVIVSDWRMPRIDGLELCRLVRARASGGYLYFIMLTQLSMNDENHQAALEAGVDDFLAKPVNVRDLRLRLHVAERILHFTHEVRALKELLPICSYCKKIRDDKNYWQQIEGYINERTGSEFSHSVCPDCYTVKIVPELEALKKAQAQNAPRLPPSIERAR